LLFYGFVWYNIINAEFHVFADKNLLKKRLISPMNSKHKDIIPFYTPLSVSPAIYKMSLDIIDNNGLMLKGVSLIEWTHKGNKPLQVLQVKGKYDMLTLTGRENYIIEQDDDITLINFADPLKDGEKIIINIEFASNFVNSQFCDGDGSVLIPQSSHIQWYPYLAWDMPVCGHYTVEVNEPDGYRICATGEKNGNIYTQNYVNIFGLLLCRGLEYSEQITGDVTIKAFYKKENKSAAQKLMETSADVIGYFKELMGFYPQRSYSFLPYSSTWGGGGNWSTGIAFFHNMHEYNNLADNEKPWIAAHEICHHYWGEYVPDGDYCGWLWIGLGMMMDDEYSASRGLTWANSGRAQRVINYYNRGNDISIWRSVEDIKKAERDNDYNSIIRHSKSYSVMYMLRKIIGRETLLDIMKYILSEYAGRALRTMDFWRICEEKSGQRLDWFFNDCLHSSHIAGYEIASVEKNESGVTAIVDSFGGFKFPVYAEARSAEGSIIHKQLNRLMNKQILHFNIKSEDVEITLNTDDRLLIQTKKEDYTLTKEIEKAGYVDDGKSLERYGLFKSQPIKESEVLFKLASQLFIGKHYNEAEDVNKSIYLSDNGVWRMVSCLWLGLIADITGKREKAIEYYNELLSIFPDDVPGFNFSQIDLTVDKDWLKQHLNTPYILSE
jgi:tetratricopeptide (TPR) repeat protein